MEVEKGETENILKFSQNDLKLMERGEELNGKETEGKERAVRQFCILTHYIQGLGAGENLDTRLSKPVYVHKCVCACVCVMIAKEIDNIGLRALRSFECEEKPFRL
jgi:hypothetical protein